MGTRGQESNREMQEWRGEKKQMRMRIEERAEKEGRGEKEKDETRENREERRERKREAALQRRGGEGRSAGWGNEEDPIAPQHTPEICCSHQQNVLEDVCRGLEIMFLRQVLTHKRQGPSGGQRHSRREMFAEGGLQNCHFLEAVRHIE